MECITIPYSNDSQSIRDGWAYLYFHRCTYKKCETVDIHITATGVGWQRDSEIAGK